LSLGLQTLTNERGTMCLTAESIICEPKQQTTFTDTYTVTQTNVRLHHTRTEKQTTLIQ